MIKTKEELQAQAKEKNIRFYPVHDCSMCGYMCGYVIAGDDVGYDSGCDCIGGRPRIERRDWEDLTDCYNMNQPERNPNIQQSFLDTLNKTWQFTNSK